MRPGLPIALRLLVLLLGVLLPIHSHGAEAYFDIPLSELRITSGEVPKTDPENSSRFRFDPRWNLMEPRVWIDGPGEAYLDAEGQSWVDFRYRGQSYASSGRLLVHLPQARDLQGRLALPNSSGKDMTLLSFSIPAAAAHDNARDAFARAKLNYYRRLRSAPIPGAAWFRHQLEEVEKQVPADSTPPEMQRPLRWNAGRAEPDDAYALFSGGRAVSENLKLASQLPEAAAEQPTVPIDSLEGITIAEIDWRPLVKDTSPELDTLARLIPEDQHVVFFPSLAAAEKLADEVRQSGGLILQLAEPRSEDAGTLARYQKQLGLSFDAVSRVLGPHLIGSIALTGSDPYFRTGTDVAVLFETTQPSALAAALRVQIENSARSDPTTKTGSGSVGGINYQSFRSDNRNVSAYLAQLDGAVVVTNSLAQLERLASVGKGVKPLAELLEYQFFRHRYPRTDKDETALFCLSDATIRRWCSPRWRIASARRTRLASTIAEETAKSLEESAIRETNGAEKIKIPPAVRVEGDNTLGWLSPIIEMPIDKVTRSEAEAYKRWRDNYQRNWRWAFDPIALRITVSDSKLAGDLTVMPLIAGTEYREFIAVSQGAEIRQDSGDRHGSLLNVILAINPRSPPLQQAANIASSMAPGVKIEPLGWLGSAISIYVDDDPVWKEIQEAAPEAREKMLREALGRLPIALQAEVASPLKLAAFLTALRAFIEQTAPGMTAWDSLTYREQPYVRVTATEQGRRQGGDIDLSIFYSASADALIVTINEDTLKRAIDRRLDRKPGEIADQPLPWLGSSLCLQVDRKMFNMLSSSMLGDLTSGSDVFQTMMQVRCWGNLPILNEWKRLYPNEDPVKLHEMLWQTRLVCPGGGQYAWNDEWKTMESTVYGHPGQPKDGPGAPEAVARFKTGNFGLTFENQGLRARLEITRKEAK